MKNAQQEKSEVAEMQMLQRMGRVTKLDRIRNERIREMSSESGVNIKV